MTRNFHNVEIHYKQVEKGDYESVYEFLITLGWKKRLRSKELFFKLLDNTNLKLIAIEKNEIVGFVRALCDSVSNGYISMLVVTPNRRSIGIGKGLMTRLMGDDPYITWTLRVNKKQALFFKKLGFKKSTVSMEKIRQKGEVLQS